MNSLPDDNLSDIMLQMSIQSLYSFCQLNKRTQNICHNEHFWQSRVSSHAPSELSHKPEFLTWKHYDKILEIGIFISLYLHKQYRTTINIPGKALLSNDIQLIDTELNDKIFPIRSATAIRVYVGADGNILSIVLSQNDIPMNIVVIEPKRRLINLERIYLNTDIDLIDDCITIIEFNNNISSGITNLKKAVIKFTVKLKQDLTKRLGL